ncbi:PKD domain-containing protein [Undibacterium sp. Xuan67W]|uniref:PKD domain-containing protein n=1 Tax=Undibacterium sp. Xuan67W TaxID=3413057 RepID=UPI003BF51E5B
MVSVFFRIFALVLLTSVAACGGGSSGSGGGASSSPIAIAFAGPASVSTGDPLTFTASVSSSAAAISSVTWRIEALTLDAAALAASSNTDCKVATKSTTGSDWSCVVSLTPPAKLTADYTYKLTVTVVDAKNNSTSSSTNLVVLKEASITLNPAVKVAANSEVTSGSKATLSCSGSGGTTNTGVYAYQWVISDAANLTLKITSASSAVTDFTAPIVTTPTVVKFECRVTDDKPRTGTAIQTLTINPVIKPTIVPISYSGGVAQAGAAVSLDGSKTMRFDVNGNQVTTGAIYYLWTQKSGPAVSIVNANSAIATVALPSDIVTKTTFLFTLNVSNAPIDASGNSTEPVQQVDVVYFVDSLPPLSITSYVPTQTVASGNNVTLTAATPSAATGHTVYYSWTQISGPSVVLASASSSNAGFIAPTVTSKTLLVFRVSASYQPITTANPGSVSTDVLVQVTP